MARSNPEKHDWSRRNFLQTVGAGVPTLKLLLEPAQAHAQAVPGASAELDPDKFSPIDLGSYFNASPSDVGSRERAKGLSGDPNRDGLVRTPAGEQHLRGIPFRLGPEGMDQKRWIALSSQGGSWTSARLDIPLSKGAGFVCLAAFCDWDENEKSSGGVEVFEKVGQPLAEATIVYEDGSEKVFPIRRRFEVNSLSFPWGHMCFAAAPCAVFKPVKLTDPLPSGFEWGIEQQAFGDRTGNYAFGPDRRLLPMVWISTFENPTPDKSLKALRLHSTSSDVVFVCGLTLFHSHTDPLLYERLSLYRLTLPEPAAEEEGRWKVDVDLGIVARTFLLGEFEPESWLRARD